MLSCKSLTHRMVNSSLPVSGRFHWPSHMSQSCKRGSTWAPREEQGLSVTAYGALAAFHNLSLPYQLLTVRPGIPHGTNIFKIIHSMPRNAFPAQHNLTKPGKEWNTLWRKTNIYDHINDLSMKPLTSFGSGFYSSPLENCWIFILVPKIQRSNDVPEHKW